MSNGTHIIEELKRREDRRYNALSAAQAMVELDPHAREDLISYLGALNEAQRDGDKEEQEYIARAILEVFEIEPVSGGVELDAWGGEVLATEAGKEAKRRLEEETERFFQAYAQCKAKSGLTTIREIAAAAKISPTTVNAIEQQRVKPQFRTIRALAKAFGVEPGDLAGAEA